MRSESRAIAAGYVEQLPLIARVAWRLRHTIGTSLWTLRLPPALASCDDYHSLGLLARKFGGRRWAESLASLAVLMAAALLALSHFFIVNALDRCDGRRSPTSLSA